LGRNLGCPRARVCPYVQCGNLVRHHIIISTTNCAQTGSFRTTSSQYHRLTTAAALAVSFDSVAGILSPSVSWSSPPELSSSASEASLPSSPSTTALSSFAGPSTALTSSAEDRDLLKKRKRYATSDFSSKRTKTDGLSTITEDIDDLVEEGPAEEPRIVVSKACEERKRSWKGKGSEAAMGQGSSQGKEKLNEEEDVQEGGRVENTTNRYTAAVNVWLEWRHSKGLGLGNARLLILGACAKEVVSIDQGFLAEDEGSLGDFEMWLATQKFGE